MKYTASTVHLPKGMRPQDFEISAAAILSQFFHADVYFTERGIIKTPDIEIDGRFWELKSPKGNSPRTIQNNLRKADNQSENIIIDLRRCKMHGDKAIGYIKAELSRATRIKKLLVITKSGNIIVIL